jgi:hypothetical protein
MLRLRNTSDGRGEKIKDQGAIAYLINIPVQFRHIAVILLLWRVDAALFVSGFV